MTTLYRYEVGTNVYEEGVTAYPVKGQAVEVEGRRMVELAHGVIVPDAGWSATQAEASLLAALEIERMAGLLCGQSVQMRSQIEELLKKGVE